VLAISAAILLAADLLLKSWAAANLPGQPRFLIDGILELRYTRNEGAAFGLFGGFNWARWGLSALKVAILAALFWYYHKLPLVKRFWIVRIPVIMIIAGGLGNLFDRVAFGYVRDMLRFYFIPRFAIFNLADVYVTVGVFVFIFIALFIAKDMPLPFESSNEKN
jgi:signal peptidase II